MTDSERAALLQRPTITIPQYAEIFEISRGLAYESARRGEVQILSIGKRRLVVTAPLRRKLGMEAV